MFQIALDENNFKSIQFTTKKKDAYLIKKKTKHFLSQFMTFSHISKRCHKTLQINIYKKDTQLKHYPNQQIML